MCVLAGIGFLLDLKEVIRKYVLGSKMRGIYVVVSRIRGVGCYFFSMAL